MELGVLAASEDIAPRDEALALTRLKGLLGQWEMEGLVIKLGDGSYLDAQGISAIVATDPHNVPLAWFEGIVFGLIEKLAGSFGKTLTEVQIAQVRTTKRALMEGTASAVTTAYAAGSWGKLIEQAFREIQVIQEGEKLGSSQQSTAMIILQDMLDQWILHGHMNPAPVHLPTFLVTGANAKQIYRIGLGPSGSGEEPDILSRPLSAVTAVVYTSLERLAQVTLSPFDYQAWARDQYFSYDNRAPTAYYFEGGLPHSTLWLSSSARAGDSFVVTGRTRFAVVEMLSELIDLPDGYQKLLRQELAMGLSPHFPKANLSPVTISGVKEGRQLLERRNARPIQIEYDASLMAISYDSRRRRYRRW